MTGPVNTGPPSAPAIPFLVACIGIATFSGMDAVMKGLTLDIGAYNAMFWRCLLGTLFSGLLFFAGRNPWPTRPAFKLHFLRSAVASVMAVTFFWGIARMPLAEGIALSFIAPLIALYLAAVTLHEKIERGALAATLLGFAGVIVIVAGRARGDYSRDALLGAGAILFSAVLYAVNIVLMRQQAQAAKPLEITFFQNLLVALILGLASPFLATIPSADHLPGLAFSAVLAICSLLLLAWAYARAQTQHLLPVEYTAFVWAALFGYLVFREHVTLTTVGGTVLIVAGCLLATWRKKMPAAALEGLS
jgi:S-adenosylmethionine uptake transporter